MAVVPGSNGRGPATQLLRIFECLMLGGIGRDGTRILQQQTVDMITKRRRIGMYDVVQGVLCDWSLGLFVKTVDSGPQITGHHSSRETYGHGGSQSSVGFVDPKHKLAVMIVCNTRPGPKHHFERMCEISSAIYADLGLADPANVPPRPPSPRQSPPLGRTSTSSYASTSSQAAASSVSASYTGGVGIAAAPLRYGTQSGGGGTMGGTPAPSRRGVSQGYPYRAGMGPR